MQIHSVFLQDRKRILRYFHINLRMIIPPRIVRWEGQNDKRPDFLFLFGKAEYCEFL
ncbi:hypothetical protein D3C80_450940 [compost metagenome]